MAIAREDYSVGKVGFVARHELYTDEQKDAAERVAAAIEEQGLRQVRVSWADQHGLARGKTLTAPDFVRALRNGQDFQSATLIMDTSNNIFVPLFVPGSGSASPS
jgi:glutamine synthetase